MILPIRRRQAPPGLCTPARAPCQSARSGGFSRGRAVPAGRLRYTYAMAIDLSGTTIDTFPHAFITKRSEPVLIQTLQPTRHGQLVEMYLSFEPRNSFSGLPPIADSACTKWVEGMIATGANLVALSFEDGVAGHAALFDIDARTCEIFVCVLPKCQRIGIGTELTRCLIQLAHELDFEGIRLNVEAGNHVARHVYEKCGFRYETRSLIGEVDMSLDLQRYRLTLDVPVREIMNRRVIAVRAETPCRDALGMFLDDGIATLPVVDEAGKLAGILSETDLLAERNLHKLVGEVLTRDVISVQDGTPVAKVIPLFRSRRLRCVPVLDRHMKLVGVVGRRDVLAHYLKRL